MPHAPKGNEKKAAGFWSTVPGVLTAAAAVITAVGGLITVFYTIGALSPGERSAPIEEDLRPSEEAERMPSLAVPQDGSTVSQPYVQPWPFRWDEPSAPAKVQQYHLRVSGPSAAYPVVDVKVNGTEHTSSKSCSYIADQNRLGWKWQVRAQFQDGSWGPWSRVSTFDVSLFNNDLFCQRCPDAEVCH